MVNRERLYLIGIDIGTQGIKAALFDLRGRKYASAFRPSKLLRPAAGAVEEDPERQLKSVCQCVRVCVEQAEIDPASVAALGIDGQMAGVIGIGADGMHVTPYDSWLDTRCAPYITLMQQRAGRQIIQRTGGPPSFNHGPKILWWKHERPDVYRQITSFVQPGGYVALRLCGLGSDEAFIDKSYLHFSGFANNAKGTWDAELCETFDVAPVKLPRIVDSHTVIGTVSPAMARRCRLHSGTPLIAGCGDTAASFLACGATREGVCVDVAGTASVFAATTRQFQADTELGVLGWGQSATPGLWHPYAYVNGGGLNLEWFATELAGRQKSETSKTLRQLERRAARLEPQGSDPIFIPHLGGRNSPSRPDLRGAWAGLTWSHTAGHLYRALLEGVALEYCIYLEGLERLNPELEIKEIRVTGGGEKSELWNRIKADTLGVRVVQVTRQEGAPLGAALLAGFGVGLFSSLDRTAGQWIKTGSVFSPDARLGEHYASRRKRYQQLLQQLQVWSES